MKRLTSIVVAAFAVFATAAFIVPVASVSAQSSASLSIVPKKNYRIEPGKSVDDTLVIRNLDREDSLELSLRVVDFTHDGDGGTPKLMLGEDAPQTTWSLKPFLTIPQNVTIDPGASKTIDMNVSIPANHGAGSYYSAIVYSSGAPDGGNVGLSASGVTLVFTQIPGEVNQDLTLQKFGAYHRATPGREAGYSFITMQEPETMAYTLKNDGNVTESPVGSITLRDIFGREIVIDNVNPNGSLALIGQTRTYVSCIKLEAEQVEFGGRTSSASRCASPGLWPGYYRASLDLLYGRNDDPTSVQSEITGSASFWYLPMWFLIILTIVAAIIAYFVWRIVQKIKARKNRANPTKAFRRK